ncbi:MAG: hypothetical protein R3E97_19875 [Candidatus Eisenbacteria bacterium]
MGMAHSVRRVVGGAHRGVADGVEKEIALLQELDLRSNEITVILRP